MGRLPLAHIQLGQLSQVEALVGRILQQVRREQRCQLDFAALQVKERQVNRRRRMEREEEEEGGFPHERPYQELQLSSLSRPGLQPIMARQRFFFRDLQ